MSTWHTSSAPKAALTLEVASQFLVPSRPGESEDGEQLTTDGTGIITAHGNIIHYYRTRNGIRFARVVDVHGFILWLQEVL